ncbi:MAG TPA: alpha/beta hydrolase [Steroidobacteraceae bacterium]
MLIHGLGQCRLSWIRQLNSDLIERYQFVTYDLRGHGQSDKPTEERYYAQGRRWGDELAAVIGALKLRRAALVGWSLGGIVMLNYLTEHGHERIAAMNFVDAWTSLDPSVYTDEAGELTDTLRSSDLMSRLGGIKTFLRACFHVQPDPELFELMLTFNAMPPIEFYKGVQRVTLDASDAALRALPIPVVVTHGAKDRLFRTAVAQYTAQAVPGARLSIYENIGHSPFLEDSQRFNLELKTLLSRAFA